MGLVDVVEESPPENLIGSEKCVSVYPSSSNLQLLTSRNGDSVAYETRGLYTSIYSSVDEEDPKNLLPLCSFNPGSDWSSNSSDWVLRKVEELRSLVGLSCDG